MHMPKIKNSVKQETIFLSGSMDKNSINEISKNFTLPKSDFILNLKNIVMIDSAGIGFLVKLLKSTLKLGTLVKLSEVPTSIMVVLRLTQIDQFFEIIEPQDQNIAEAA